MTRHKARHYKRPKYFEIFYAEKEDYPILPLDEFIEKMNRRRAAK